jgi:hypothetical protein
MVLWSPILFYLTMKYSHSHSVQIISLIACIQIRWNAFTLVAAGGLAVSTSACTCYKNIFYCFWAVGACVLQRFVKAKIIQSAAGIQIFCARISRKIEGMDSADRAVDFESSVMLIGSGRDIISSLAVSQSHPHLFIALVDGHCMRWSFACSPEATGTVVVESTSDLVFPKTGDVRLGSIHSMHASPYGSFLTLTRSSQPPVYSQSLRLPRAIYIQRCNTDAVIFPLTVAASIACFISPWNGCAALELYSTCQRTHAYWKDSLLAIWSLVCHTDLSLSHSFRALQVRCLSASSDEIFKRHSCVLLKP